MFDEGARDRSKTIAEILKVFPCNKPWPTHNETAVYYNAGVMLCSKEASLLEFVNINELQKIYKKVSLFEQTYFNYLLVKHDLIAESIAQAYNQMVGFCQQPEDRFNAYFIHYAGKGYAKNTEGRSRTAIQDYIHFYGNTDPWLTKLRHKLKFAKFVAKNRLRRLRRKFTH